MDYDITLKDGSIIRLAPLGGHCVPVMHGKDGRWTESGMNRYGIIDEEPLKEDSAQASVSETIIGMTE